MKILAIECTHGFASVAVGNRDSHIEHRLPDWQKTAEALVPLIARVMDEAGLSPSGLDGVAVSSGPGSFTALRIGMSVAKGIACGADCPLVPVPTMQAMAQSVMHSDFPSCIVTLVPSRAGEYFCSVFSAETGSPVETESFRSPVVELLPRLLSLDRAFIIAARSIGLLATEAPSLSPYLCEASSFSASSLLLPAEQVLSSGLCGTAYAVVPDYRQAFEPVRNR